MKDIRKILEKEKMIWFEVERKNAKKFLIFAKKLNFKWINGNIINPDKDETFFHLSLDSNGFLSNVAMFAWLSPTSKHIKRFKFEDFLKIKSTQN
ncbi:MAG: hypothetical protein IKJ33_03230 [Clostridia bacterium]|nr:hypothetical protein [Clostridia bacterium]